MAAAFGRLLVNQSDSEITGNYGKVWDSCKLLFLHQGKEK